jgi:ligand-binding sensor domain-containing protein
MKNIFKKTTGMIMMLFVTMIHAQTFTNYTTVDGLPDNNVYGVAIDSHNIKWFGTQAGVARFNDTVFKVYTTADGLIDNYINCIAIDKYDIIWVGTDVGVGKLDGTQWTSYTTANGLINNMISYIAGDPDGSVWIGTNGGLSRYDGSVWTNYTTTNGLPNNMVSYISIDKEGNKWIGTWIGGLTKFDGTTFTTFTTEDSLADNNITAIAIDDNRNKWIGTYYGISVLDSLDKWTVDYTANSGLYNDFVKDLCFDSKGNLWTGMYADYLQDGGITKFSNPAWVSYTVTNGLVDKFVRRLAVDKKDNVWIATGNGVSKLTLPNTGIENVSNGSMKIYPNPAKDFLHIDQVNHPVQLGIYDITGNKLISQKLSGQSNVADIRTLSPGVYILKIEEEGQVVTRKVIVL